MSDDPWYDALLIDRVDRQQGRTLGRLRAAQGSLESQLELVEQQNDQLVAQVARLEAMVQVLGSHLVTRGIVNGAEIAEELRRVLEPESSAARAAPATPQGSAYRGQVAKPAATAMVPCASCAQIVPASSTQFSERGALCEACFRQEELARLSKLEGEG